MPRTTGGCLRGPWTALHGASARSMSRKLTGACGRGGVSVGGGQPSPRWCAFACTARHGTATLTGVLSHRVCGCACVPVCVCVWPLPSRRFGQTRRRAVEINAGQSVRGVCSNAWQCAATRHHAVDQCRVGVPASACLPARACLRVHAVCVCVCVGAALVLHGVWRLRGTCRAPFGGCMHARLADPPCPARPAVAPAWCPVRAPACPCGVFFCDGW